MKKKHFIGVILPPTLRLNKYWKHTNKDLRVLSWKQIVAIYSNFDPCKRNDITQLCLSVSLKMHICTLHNAPSPNALPIFPSLHISSEIESRTFLQKCTTNKCSMVYKCWYRPELVTKASRRTHEIVISEMYPSLQGHTIALNLEVRVIITKRKCFWPKTSKIRKCE